MFVCMLISIKATSMIQNMYISDVKDLWLEITTRFHQYVTVD